MRFLKTNTATRVTVGPFLDQTAAITPQTALTVTSEKLTFIVDTGGVPTLVLDTAPTASGGANDMVHVSGDDAGFYDLELAAANVNYVGRAMLSLNNVAAHCPVFHEFTILPAEAYDTLVGGTDAWTVNLVNPQGVKKNAALPAFMFPMPATGLTVTATRSLDGAAFAACANSVTEVSDKWYKITLAATDLNADVVALRFAATGHPDTDLTITTVQP